MTAVAATKGYDGTTSSTGVPTVAPGVVAPDVAAFVQTYDTRNAGTGKTLTPSGAVNDGNSGANYTVTFTASANGTITPLAITVTAVAATKVYDGTTSSTGVPTVAPGVIAPDVAAFVQTYDTRNAGTGKTLTPSGSVTDGNGGANYAVSFTANANGTITPRAITVTAVAATKVYDGTASSTGVPTVAPGVVAPDAAAFTQTFDTKNVGTVKTLTPSGSVSDGNGGMNYAVTFTTTNTGVITARAITVTAVADSKVYDGTTNSAGAPTVSAPGIAVGDTANFVQTFDTKNVGTGKTLTPSGSVSDGNGGVNYAVTFTTTNTGVITARAITVTAVADSRVYDGTTNSAGVPTVSAPGIAVGDAANFVQTFDTKNVGTGKTLTPSGSVTDGNSSANYAVTFASTNTGVITARAITVTAAAATKAYDGTTASTVTPTVGVPGIAAGDTAGFIQTYDTPFVGTGKTLTPSGMVNDGNGGSNYAVTSVASNNGVILTVCSAFNGFLPPIGGAVENNTGGTFADPVRAFKLNSTIPVKFSATCYGAPLMTGIHTLQAIKYSNATDSDAPIDATPTDAATTGNEFRLTGSEWHFNLKTKGSMTQGTWLLKATLFDGSSYTVWVSIKK